MQRPGWASSPVGRRWLVAGAVVFLLLAGRSATRSFNVEATLSDGARAYASCKAPWRSARLAPPAQRFTLLVVTGGTGERRAEAEARLGARCRHRARIRLGVAALGLAGSGLLAWLALPRRRPGRNAGSGRDTMRP